MRRREVKYYRTEIEGLFLSLPCSPLILEIKGKGSHPCCFQVVEGFFCFLCCPHLMAQIRLCWTPLALGSPLDTWMDLSILTWLKPSKLMHSMPLSIPLSWTESLHHLEHEMGHWYGPAQKHQQGHSKNDKRLGWMDSMDHCHLAWQKFRQFFS